MGEDVGPLMRRCGVVAPRKPKHPQLITGIIQYPSWHIAREVVVSGNQIQTESREFVSSHMYLKEGVVITMYLAREQLDSVPQGEIPRNLHRWNYIDMGEDVGPLMRRCGVVAP